MTNAVIAPRASSAYLDYSVIDEDDVDDATLLTQPVADAAHVAIPTTASDGVRSRSGSASSTDQQVGVGLGVDIATSTSSSSSSSVVSARHASSRLSAAAAAAAQQSS